MKKKLTSLVLMGALALAGFSYIANPVPSAQAATSTFVDRDATFEPGEKGFALVGFQKVASVGSITAGSGYTSLPAISFTGGGGGKGAAAYARLKVVGTVTVVGGGTGYADGDTIKVTGGTASTAMILTVAETGGVIDSLTITNAGVYSVPVTTSGAATTTLTGSGTGATITLSWGIASITVTEGGDGYSSAPTVVLTGGGGSSGAGTATLASTHEVETNFEYILPLADFVAATLETDPKIGKGKGPYYDVGGALVGKTLTKGVLYRVHGTKIKATSGTALLYLR